MEFGTDCRVLLRGMLGQWGSGPDAEYYSEWCLNDIIKLQGNSVEWSTSS